MTISNIFQKIKMTTYKRVTLTNLNFLNFSYVQRLSELKPV